MTKKGCEDCPVKELQKIHRLVEKRVLGKLPAEVQEPVREAKKQMGLALRGLLEHALKEQKPCQEKNPVQSRAIELD